MDGSLDAKMLAICTLLWSERKRNMLSNIHNWVFSSNGRDDMPMALSSMKDLYKFACLNSNAVSLSKINIL